MDKEDSTSLNKNVSITISEQFVSILKTLRVHWQEKLEKEKIASQLKLYIPTSIGCSETSEPVDRKNGLEEMESFLLSSHSLMLLLGDSGAGKSLFSQWVVNNLWEQQTIWIPLIIHLPSHKIKKGFFEEFLYQQCQLNVEQVNLLREKGKIFLILDSYDEMKKKYFCKNPFEFGELYRWNMKVVVTCRTEALVAYSLEEQRRMFVPFCAFDKQQNHAWIKRFVQLFELNSQVPQYIKLWKENNPDFVSSNLDYIHVIKTLPGVSEMIRNPFILWVIMTALPSLLDQYESLPMLERYHLTRLNLFDAFTLAWFERQRNKLLKNEVIDSVRALTIVDDFMCYCQQLANLMWQLNLNEVTYEAEKTESSTSVWNSFFSLEGNFNDDPNKPLAQIRQGALLKVFDGKKYAFLHRTLLEYFSAKQLFESAANKANIAMGLEINSQLLINNPAMIRLGVDRLAQDSAFEKVLWDILEESKHEPRVQTAAANAITILNAANKSFSGKDLRRIRVRYAILSGGNFDGTDLREADLRDVNFSQAWLSRSDLSGSCVDRIITSTLPGEQLDAEVIYSTFAMFGAYYAVITNQTLFIYEAMTHKCIVSGSTRLYSSKEINSYVDTFYENHRVTVDLECATSMGNPPFIEHGRITTCAFTHLTSCVYQKGKFPVILASNQGLLYECDIDRWLKTQQSNLEPEIEDSFFVEMRNYCREIQSVNKNVIPTHSVVNAFSIIRMNNQCKLYYNCNSVILFLMSFRHLYEGPSQVLGLVFSRNGMSLLTYSQNKFLKFWNGSDEIEQVALAFVWNEELEGRCISWHEELSCSDAMALNSNGSWALTGSMDGTIKRWETRTGKCVASWMGHKVATIVINEDDTWALTGSLDGTIKRWKIVTGECLATWEGHKGRIKTISLGPDESWVLTGSSDGSIRRWETLTGKSLLPNQGHNKRITSLKLSADKNWVFSDSDDGTCKRWQMTTGNCVETFEGRVPLDAESQDFLNSLNRLKADYSSVALSLVGNLALAGKINGVIDLLDFTNQELIATWQGHNEIITAITFNHDGSLALSADNNGKVILWQVKVGKIIAACSLSNPVTVMKWFSGDPDFILMGMDDGTLSSWSFQARSKTMRLIWRSKPWDLQANNSKLLGVYGLSQQQQVALAQKGVQVQVSSKSSEEVLAHRQAQLHYDSKKPPQSLFDSSIHVLPEAWVISIARRKMGIAERHAFLLLESIEDGYYRIRRIDFVLELRHQMLPKDSIAPRKVDRFGQGLIEIAEKSHFDIQSLVGQCCARSSGITPKQGLKLLENIRTDQSQRLGYCLMGTGSMYRMFRMREVTEQHNCLSWCEKHLEEIGVNLIQRKWIDGIVNYPPARLRDDKDIEANKSLRRGINSLRGLSPRGDKKDGDQDNDGEPGHPDKCVMM